MLYSTAALAAAGALLQTAAAEFSPYYPAPAAGWTADWAESHVKARALVARMTLAEKTNITSGSGVAMGARCAGNTGSVPRLGFPSLCLNDGFIGVRNVDNITVFPPGISVAATFDKTLMHERAVAAASEFRNKGISVAMGPTIGPLGRKPRAGRNWESFGPDPSLQAIAGSLTVRGVQSLGLISTIKHLVANEQEIERMYYGYSTPAYSSNVDDRAMNELYLWPFAEAIHAGAGSVMAAYNDINGTTCTQNSYLLNKLVKEELGFQGFIVSDWLSQLSGVSAALAGLDVSMPGDSQEPLTGTSFYMYELTRAALNDTVPLDRIDDMATRVVAAWYQMGQDTNPLGEITFSAYSHAAYGALSFGATNSPLGRLNSYVDVRADHATVARKIATDAITLLKNDNKLLPLSAADALSVFGTDAAVNPLGPNNCTSRACDVGTLGSGWGSGTADYTTFDDPITALRSRDASAGGSIAFYNNDTFPANVTAASADDVAIVFINANSGENDVTVDAAVDFNRGDREKNGLVAWHSGDELVQAAAAAFSRVVVVVHTVGPIIVEPWIDLPAVQAVLFAHLPGQEAGESLADVLFGVVAPSGHLPYSIPANESDYPASLSLTLRPDGLPNATQLQDNYTEGLYIDYRYLQKNGIKPRYAFGHGLSYANFSVADATITVATTLTSTAVPARTAKTGLAASNTTQPAAAEATFPAGSVRLTKYLYSWLNATEAEAAVAARSTPYAAYPAGYSTVQKTAVADLPKAGGGSGGHPALWDVAYNLSVIATNTLSSAAANVAARAVVQAYLQYPAASPYDAPIVQLRDFAKTAAMLPGQGERVQVQLTRKDLSVWDVEAQNWVLPGGLPSEARYTVWLGEASDDLHTACYTDTLTCESGLAGPF